MGSVGQALSMFVFLRAIVLVTSVGCAVSIASRTGLSTDHEHIHLCNSIFCLAFQLRNKKYQQMNDKSFATNVHRIRGTVSIYIHKNNLFILVRQNTSISQQNNPNVIEIECSCADRTGTGRSHQSVLIRNDRIVVKELNSSTHKFINKFIYNLWARLPPQMNQVFLFQAYSFIWEQNGMSYTQWLSGRFHGYRAIQFGISNECWNKWMNKYISYSCIHCELGTAK